MFKRQKTKHFRADVPPFRRHRGRKAVQMHFRKQNRIARQQFTLDSSEFVEDDVLVVDNSMKSSTSQRSVEVTQGRPTSFQNESQRSFELGPRDSSSSKVSEQKRNRLFQQISAIVSRRTSQPTDHGRQNRNDVQTESSIDDAVSGKSKTQASQSEKREVICYDDISPLHSLREPATPMCSEQPSPTPASNDVCEKDRDNIVIRSDCQSSRVVNLGTRKRTSTTSNENRSEPASQVRKSETLTIVIPQKRAVLSEELKRKLLLSSKPVATRKDDASSSAQATSLPVDSHNVSIHFHPSVVRPQDSVAKKKDDLELVSDDESDDRSNCKALRDPPVVKSTVPGKSIIPYSLDDHAFSNLYECEQLFIHDLQFSSTEQFYVWTLAKFCKDFSAANAILYLKDPTMIKQVASKLKIQERDFEEWMRFSWKVRMKAAMAKFKQNRSLRQQLFRTMGSTLVEANNNDAYWGIGLSIDDPEIADPSKWRGANVMGEVLMQIRDVLKDNPEYIDEVKTARKNLLVAS